MNLDSVAGGLISATYLVPISIAFCIAASHGKYLPLWLPDVGLVGAYVSYAIAEVMHFPVALALFAGILVSALVSVALYSGFFRGHVERAEPYPALLRAIALTVFIEASLAWSTHGYALVYQRLKIPGSVYLSGLGQTLTGADVVAALGAIIFAPGLTIVLRRTRVGLVFRSVASNRGLAWEYGLPVRAVDIAVLALCGGLSAAGAIMFAIRYDLSADMLGQPTMKVAAVAVALGTEWPGRVVAGIMAIGVLEAWAQSSPTHAPFASAIGYILLIAALLLRYALPKLIRRLRR